jgi:hypothetical protein
MLASTPFGAAKPGEDRASLFADEASYRANSALSMVEKPFDATKEKLLVVQTWPREASYSYVRETGTRTIIVRVDRALPCLDAAELERFREGYPTFVFVTVPRDVDQVRIEARDTSYRLETPNATTACVRDESAVIAGGGAPSAYDEGGALGLAFGGFSAMTGNVFTSTSMDGIVFSPAGWSQERLMRFSERGPYAGVYSPFLERVADGYRLTARSDATERIVDGKIVRRGASIVETSAKDGVSFGPERVLLDDPTAQSPSRVTMTNGESWLYVVGEGGVVRLARETEGRYALEEKPVFALDTSAHPEASLGVLDAEVRRVGDEIWMMYSAGGGGLARDRPWRTSLGLAKSRDGRTFVPRDGWLLTQERASETGGFGAASFVVREGKTDIYFTMVNAASEPAIGHARCPAL